jgi:hypothetical protein
VAHPSPRRPKPKPKRFALEGFPAVRVAPLGPGGRGQAEPFASPGCYERESHLRSGSNGRMALAVDVDADLVFVFVHGSVHRRASVALKQVSPERAAELGKIGPCWIAMLPRRVVLRAGLLLDLVVGHPPILPHRRLLARSAERLVADPVLRRIQLEREM